MIIYAGRKDRSGPSAKRHIHSPAVSQTYTLTLCRKGKNLFQAIRQRREIGLVERRFAFSGASSVCDSQTEEAPERAKRLSTIPISRLCLIVWNSAETNSEHWNIENFYKLMNFVNQRVRSFISHQLHDWTTSPGIIKKIFVCKPLIFIYLGIYENMKSISCSDFQECRYTLLWTAAAVVRYRSQWSWLTFRGKLYKKSYVTVLLLRKTYQQYQQDAVTAVKAREERVRLVAAVKIFVNPEVHLNYATIVKRIVLTDLERSDMQIRQ